MLLLLAALARSAHADSITLDTGATIEGDLARYEFGGDCQLSVTEGDLSGVILIVPCHRVQSFVRTAVRTPVPIGLEEEAIEVAAAGEAPAQPVIDAVSASVPVAATAGASGGAAPVGETRALSFGQGAGAVALPDEAVEEAPFYDEPLFPSDPATPISAATPSRSAPAVAPSEPTGPRAAPRMDDLPAPATERRSVSF